MLKNKYWKKRLSKVLGLPYLNSKQELLPIEPDLLLLSMAQHTISNQTGSDSSSAYTSDTEYDCTFDDLTPITVLRGRVTFGPSSLLPVGDLSPKRKGRFTISRELMESYQWSPKDKYKYRPSRFYN